MTNVIDFSGFTLTPGPAPAEVHCWLCQKGNSLRAFFCQHCGTIQPVRPIDHFTRLGLERRIDIDIELLDRQYTHLQRSFCPQRFSIRGLGERNHASAQLAALEEAYLVMRDPLRRSRYWLTLHEKPVSPAGSENPLLMELRREMNDASLAQQCDRLAQKAGQAMEQGVMGLMQALRAQNWQLANALLCEVDGLEAMMAEIREKRALLKITSPTGEEDFRTVK